MNQLACLQEGHAARRRTRDSRHYRRIEPVGINGQIVVAAVRDAREHGVHAHVMKFVRGDQLRPVSFSRAQFFRAAATLRAQPDLHDLRDMFHFRCPADRTGEPVTHAVHFIAPVEMRVHMNKRDRAKAVEGAQYRRRNTVIAAHDDRQRARSEDLPHRCFYTLIVTARRREVGDHIAAIDKADIVAFLQERTVDIEIVMAGRANHAVGRLTDCRGRVGLIIGEVSRRVRGAVGHPQHGDVGLQVIQVHREFGVQQGLVAGSRCDSQWFCHD